MRTKMCGALTLVGLLMSDVTVRGHHAAQAQFDLQKTVVLTGTCVKMEWINPHAYMHLEVKDDGGRAKTWALETVGPQGLRRAGLGRGPKGIKVGDMYIVRGFPARNGTDTALIVDLKMPDGRVVQLLDVDEFRLPKDFEVK